MTNRSELSSQGQNIRILRLQMEAVACLIITGNGTFWSLMICLDVEVVSKISKLFQYKMAHFWSLMINLDVGVVSKISKHFQYVP